MSYTNGSPYSGTFIRKSNALDTAEVLSAAAAVYGGYLVTKQCKIKRIKFYVTLLVAASTTAPVVEFNRRPTYNSSSGEIALGTLTIPNGAAVGSVYYKDIDPVVLFPGDELSFEHITQAVDASAAAGAGFYAFEIEEDPEVPANQSKMIASA